MNEMQPQRTRQDVLWDLSAQLQDDPTISALLADVEERVRRRRTRLRRILAPLVGVAAAAAISAVVVMLWPAAASSPVEYATRAGEQRVVDLPDGSRLTLNTATRLRVRYGNATRGVELLAGEVLCAVHKDAERPFEVGANGGVTRAVGTQFAVQVTQAETFVAVLEGTVSVTSNASRDDSAPPSLVSAGEAVTYASTGPGVRRTHADLQRIRAWTEHRIVFDDVSLQAALADYNRYTTTPIRLANAEFSEKRVYGNFAIGDEAAFLGALGEMLPLKATRANGEIVLEAREPVAAPRPGSYLPDRG